jgi:O-ureido-D-serine cyclo-ligase
MPHIAIVTARAARDLDEDLAPLVTALRERGSELSVVDWDNSGVEWKRFDLALLRSTWDYTQRLGEFLAWAERTSAQTRLLNPFAMVRWNTDKHYLKQLTDAGIPVVSSAFVEPGTDAASALDRFLGAHPAFREFVVKPCVGAGSRDTQRHGREDRNAALAHIQRLLDGGGSVLLQPYLARVDEHGETALIYFDGVFSHAIRKGPLLRRGEDPTRALFAAEHITPRVPTVEEQSVAAQTLLSIPSEQPLLYARVDLIHDEAGNPCVLELELTEPSLFFLHAPGSAARFADRLLERARPPHAREASQ